MKEILAHGRSSNITMWEDPRRECKMPLPRTHLRCVRTSLLACAIIWLGQVACPLISAAAEDPAPDQQATSDSEPTASHERDERLARWIADLSSPQYQVRRSAQRSLIKYGSKSIPQLCEGTKSNDLEVVVQCVRILERFLLSDTPEIAAAARDALIEVVQTGSPTAQRHAQSAFWLKGEEARWVFSELGANVDFQGARGLSLYGDGSRITDDDLQWVREFPLLSSLSLGNCEITSKGLAHLEGMKQIQRLNLFGTKISDDGLVHLQGLSALVELPMGYTKVTDAGMAHLSKMVQLEYLGLRGNAITAVGLAQLTQLVNLEGMHLGETQIDDAALELLVGKTKLQTLYLNGTKITDQGLETLAKIPSLRRLDLGGTPCTSAAIERLKHAIPNLEINLTQDGSP